MHKNLGLLKMSSLRVFDAFYRKLQNKSTFVGKMPGLHDEIVIDNGILYILEMAWQTLYFAGNVSVLVSAKNSLHK